MRKVEAFSRYIVWVVCRVATEQVWKPGDMTDAEKFPYLGVIVLFVGMMAAAFFAHVRCGLNIPIVGSFILLASLLTLSFIDFRKHLLPNWLTLPLIAVGLVQNWSAGNEIWPYILGGFIGYAVIFTLSELWLQFRGQRGIGLGDAKLLAASGTWLGAFALPIVLLIASAIGLVVILTLSVFKRLTLNSRLAIPFGPCISLGMWAVWCNICV